MNDVTQFLSALGQGDSSAAEQLLPLVYDELRRLAACRLARETPGHTLQPTALVHEAYLRLVDVDCPQAWSSRGHFFGAAAEAMRRILVENARRKLAAKHGGRLNRVALSDEHALEAKEAEALLDLNEALVRLEAHDPQKADLVKLRYFAGLSETEAATALNISRATASRHWAYAKAWLFCELMEPVAS